jgi:hypothetical protein
LVQKDPKRERERENGLFGKIKETTKWVLLLKYEEHSNDASDFYSGFFKTRIQPIFNPSKKLNCISILLIHTNSNTIITSKPVLNTVGEVSVPF